MAGLRDATVYGVAMLVAVERIGPLATPYARAALVRLLRISIDVLQRVFRRAATYARALMAFRITRVMTVCFRNQTVRFRNQHGLIPENARSDFGIGTV